MYLFMLFMFFSNYVHLGKCYIWYCGCFCGFLIGTFSFWICIVVVYCWAMLVKSHFGFNDTSKYTRRIFIAIAFISTVVNACFTILGATSSRSNRDELVVAGSAAAALLLFIVSIMFVFYGYNVVTGVLKFEKAVKGSLVTSTTSFKAFSKRIRIVAVCTVVVVLVKVSVLLPSIFTKVTFYNSLSVFQAIYISMDFVMIFSVEYLYHYAAKQKRKRISSTVRYSMDSSKTNVDRRSPERRLPRTFNSIRASNSPISSPSCASSPCRSKVPQPSRFRHSAGQIRSAPLEIPQVLKQTNPSTRSDCDDEGKINT
eukprot:TRINITY_DN1624_c0_g1_i1.p1 TRINITY_DN1624_c0_g1~~TRINITY_DN1624_c0_g1_i1.p1  ORF type:complete len:313 (-),score=31.27 TRINITY_DN1624_c0_g1_i1:239-1177(-)